MDKYIGKSVLKGIAVGRIYWYQKQSYEIVKKAVADSDAEKSRFEEAIETAKDQLSALYDEALANVGEDHAMIFDIHRMMLEDDDYLEAIDSVIAEGYNAE
ncbi:MAG: phosphoenolpyruvate--protein phosphotransferase, partial [Lachnospiraceae bacterium]|nr:phosphoenolpyruvate--protein phosphotransferase [Lachnospiraceae bacterium]